MMKRSKNLTNRLAQPVITFLLTLTGLLMMTFPQAEETALAQGGPRYEVTVTNLTRGQQFTPILVATHKEGVRLFNLGEPASPQLAVLAEEGDTAPLTNLLLATPGVNEVVTAPGFLDPGASRTVTVAAHAQFDHLSVAAMLIPTNDGFFAVNGVAGPRGNNTSKGDNALMLFSPAYDAGSERNDELCASIPGPNFTECGGPGGGGMPSGNEEGYVHIHAGIHGIGDLNAAMRDWRNPVARIVIRRIP